MSLTDRQAKVFEFVKEYIEVTGCTPTTAEIADGTDVPATTAHQEVSALCAKGLLRRPFPRARTLLLVEAAEAVPVRKMEIPDTWQVARAEDGPPWVPSMDDDMDPEFFTRQERAWRAIRSRMEPGDELWLVCSPPESWRQLCGRRGFAIFRGGVPVDGVVTLYN